MFFFWHPHHSSNFFHIHLTDIYRSLIVSLENKIGQLPPVWQNILLSMADSSSFRDHCDHRLEAFAKSPFRSSHISPMTFASSWVSKATTEWVRPLLSGHTFWGPHLRNSYRHSDFLFVAHAGTGWVRLCHSQLDSISFCEAYQSKGKTSS